jgi:23S rRNA pseudouridine1911/1915/1917 synthase
MSDQESRLVFNNEACMVINKLSGESSGAFPSAAHRLDTPVSGCLLIAKTAHAAAFLGTAFAEHRIEKRYWAIVEKPARDDIPESGELIHWLRFDSSKNKSFARGEPWQGKHSGKKAILRYKILGAGKNYLFLEIELITGRHHQIRAQLAAVGLHIKGDLKYGARRSEPNGGIRLHAHSLTFPNPLAPPETIKATALPPLIDNLWTAFSG